MKGTFNISAYVATRFFFSRGIRCINTHARTHHSLHWAAAQLPSFIPRCNGQKHHIDSELKVASSSRRWHVFVFFKFILLMVSSFNLNILSTSFNHSLWMSLDDPRCWAYLLEWLETIKQFCVFFLLEVLRGAALIKPCIASPTASGVWLETTPCRFRCVDQCWLLLLMLPHQWTGQKSSKDLKISKVIMWIRWETWTTRGEKTMEKHPWKTRKLLREEDDDRCHCHCLGLLWAFAK